VKDSRRSRRPRTKGYKFDVDEITVVVREEAQWDIMII
jgi:hypothetical protein